MDGEELGPSQAVSEDVPDIEDEEDEDGGDFVMALLLAAGENLDGEDDAEEEARAVGDEQADGRDEEAGGDGGARAVVGVDGVPDGDDGPRQRREHRDEQDPPARDEGLERRLLAVHALEDAERVRQNRHCGIRCGACDGVAKS